MLGVLKIKTWAKILFTFFALFFIGFLLFALLSTGQEDEAVFCEVVLCVILGGVFSFAALYSFLCKIIVKEDYIVARKIFCNRIYKYEEITGISYKKAVFGDATYVLRFGRKKLEISQLMVNKNIMDKKLKQEGIFKKYPKVN